MVRLDGGCVVRSWTIGFFIQSLAMHILQDTAVTLKYQVTTPAGKPLDSGHLAYLHGGYDSIFPKVEAALEALEAGVKKVHIIDARIPHSVLLEIYSNQGIGTEIVL